jgi:hypothetical protein
MEGGGAFCCRKSAVFPTQRTLALQGGGQPTTTKLQTQLLELELFRMASDRPCKTLYPRYSPQHLRAYEEPTAFPQLWHRNPEVVEVRLLSPFQGTAPFEAPHAFLHLRALGGEYLFEPISRLRTGISISITGRFNSRGREIWRTHLSHGVRYLVLAHRRRTHHVVHVQLIRRACSCNWQLSYGEE